ncbi:L,D-transpeptidase family protein [Arenibaculum sp.]|jgi:murein L,D-transpeptidase YafK|uniref:L,D-transpeptidase family protein n=1 Tax=Arenibaculum sp. TaxID=2865862 RepID=UPI002E0ED4A0|nr:L,D-transpeptidase family protein [Arenibaculum sp.]
MKRRSFLLSCLGLVMAGSVPLAWRAYPAPETAILPPGVQADRIVVRKARREMTLWRGGEPFKTYEVALGQGEPGPKRREGDNRTPEGIYRISGRNPNSAYHLSLRISYPEPRDVAAAQARGEPPGSDIMIHGIRNGFGWLGTLHRQLDWTAGCIAVTNAEIEEIWRAVPDGTPIEILP